MKFAIYYIDTYERPGAASHAYTANLYTVNSHGIYRKREAFGAFGPYGVSLFDLAVINKAFRNALTTQRAVKLYFVFHLLKLLTYPENV